MRITLRWTMTHGPTCVPVTTRPMPGGCRWASWPRTKTAFTTTTSSFSIISCRLQGPTPCPCSLPLIFNDAFPEPFPMKTFIKLAAAGLIAAVATGAQADIVVGIDLGTTGPGAAIGIPTKETVLMWPRKLGDEIAHYVLLDDGSDVTSA